MLSHRALGFSVTVQFAAKLETKVFFYDNIGDRWERWVKGDYERVVSVFRL